MGSDNAGVSDVKPTDRYAQSDQAPPSGKRIDDEFISDSDAGNEVDNASEDSFPASDPPAYATGSPKTTPRSGAWPARRALTPKFFGERLGRVAARPNRSPNFYPMP
jgi:hypothetical protein